MTRTAPVRIVYKTTTSNKGCSVHASSPIGANSCFTLCTGDVNVGLECVVTWKATKRNCLNGSSSRIGESWVPTAVITYHPAKPGCPEMLTYEADQRHADLFVAAHGLNAPSKAKAINSLGQKQLSWLGIHWQDHSWTRSDKSSSAATAVEMPVLGS